MSEIGIEELQMHAANLVACARAGESITITDEGAPVALLVPIKRSGIETMADFEPATPPTRRLENLPPPAPRSAGQAPLSDVVDEMRADRI